MSGYPALADLQSWLGSSNDTTPMTKALAEARGMVERYCNRVFVAVSATKTFPVRRYVSRNGRRMLWSQDLAAVTTITNGDGIVLASSEYDLLRPDGGFMLSTTLTDFPAYGLDVRASSGKILYDGGSDTPISIAGYWGFCQTDPPEAVFGAIMELAKVIYQVRTGGGAAVAAAQNSGVFMAGIAMPDHLKRNLESWRRTAI